MKTISLFFVAAVFLVSCSSDDSKKQTCDCQKITAVYNEAMHGFETTGSAYYSDNCNDETQAFNPNGDGTYYQINCTPQD